LAFPRLYGIAIDKEASVEASLSRHGAKDRRIWDVRSFENLMIGRWMKGCIFFVYWELILHWMLKTG